MAFLGFGRRDVSDGLQEPPVVEPIDPFQSSDLDGLERAPWPAPVNDLGFVKVIPPCCSIAPRTIARSSKPATRVRASTRLARSQCLSKVRQAGQLHPYYLIMEKMIEGTRGSPRGWIASMHIFASGLLADIITSKTSPAAMGTIPCDMMTSLALLPAS